MPKYLIQYVMPVSYTHLDVYKRQGTHCAPAALAGINALLRAIPHNSKCRYGERGAAAVSYTHLDVYKRQVGSRCGQPCGDPAHPVLILSVFLFPLCRFGMMGFFI